VKKVAADAAKQDDVVLSKDYSHMCSELGQQMIIDDIKNHKLDKVLVSACSPLFHGKTLEMPPKKQV
jgi:heterodisulfide reductase subunit A